MIPLITPLLSHRTGPAAYGYRVPHPLSLPACSAPPLASSMNAFAPFTSATQYCVCQSCSGGAATESTGPLVLCQHCSKGYHARNCEASLFGMFDEGDVDMADVDWYCPTCCALQAAAPTPLPEIFHTSYR